MQGQFYINGSSLETTGLNNLSVYNPGPRPVSTTWYNWKTTSLLGTWMSSTLPSTNNWYSIAYGDNKFVTIAIRSNKIAYSTDGINWTEATMPSNASWRSVTYGNGKFVAITNDSGTTAYSTDGINWISGGTLPLPEGEYATTEPSSITYGDGKFVVVGNISNIDPSDFSEICNSFYSVDGINWISTQIPENFWGSVTYGNGKFVAFGGNWPNNVAYSIDGINWVSASTPTSSYVKSVVYGNGKFVTTPLSGNKTFYSTDGIDWNTSTLPTDGSWYYAAYGAGVYIAINVSNDTTAYSMDGINWTSNGAVSSADAIAYGNNKFIIIGYNSNTVSYLPITFSQCYTLDLTPTTVSAVYSEPSIVSALTITSVGTGTITLSDTKIYNRNSEGDIVTN